MPARVPGQSGNPIAGTTPFGHTTNPGAGAPMRVATERIAVTTASTHTPVRIANAARWPWVSNGRSVRSVSSGSRVLRLPLATGSTLLLAVTSGVLFALGFPPVDWGDAACLALSPLILAVWGQPRRRAIGLGWIAGTIGCTVLVAPAIFVAARGYFGGGLPVALGLALALPQLYGAVPIAFFALAARETLALAPGPAVALFAVPTLWVASEMARAHLGDGVPWVLLAHSQHARLWLLQIADVGGASAVSWVVALVGTGLALGLAAPARERARLAGLVALVLLAVRGYGVHALARWQDEPGLPLAVAIVQPAVPEKWRSSLARLPDVLGRLHALTRQAAVDHPTLIVWPENAVSVAVEANPRVVAALADVLDAETRVLLGAPRTVAAVGGPTTLRNAALLLDRRGTVQGVYDKQRLTPYGERVPVWLRPFTHAHDLYATADGPMLITLGAHRLGTTICAEAIDADLVRALVRDGADVLVNLAHDGWWDDTAARAQHLAAASLRAVENRRVLVRATSDGLSAIIDARGAVVRTAPARVPAVLTATVATYRATSFYTRNGDVFGWLCVGAALMLFTIVALRSSRPPPPR